MTGAPITCTPEVEAALRDGTPVVALESTIITHGLPQPRNLEAARELEGIVRAHGACPATVAVLDGRARIGLTEAELERIASVPVRKVGLRDLAVAVGLGGDGGTTVSATAFLASRAGIRVFGTGGLGGVHRGWAETWDESADLAALASTRVTVVSAGVKSILDIPATLQRLETLNVTVLGYRTATFPGFTISSSGQPLDWTVESADQVASVMAAQEDLGVSPSAILVANPVPAESQLDRDLHDRVIEEAVVAAGEEGVTGQRLTPFLLQFMLEATGGASLDANLAAVRGNVALAADIAVAWQKRRSP